MSANTNPSLLSFRRFSPERPRLSFGLCLAAGFFLLAVPGSTARANEAPNNGDGIMFQIILGGPVDDDGIPTFVLCDAASGQVEPGAPWIALVAKSGIDLPMTLLLGKADFLGDGQPFHENFIYIKMHGEIDGLRNGLRDGEYLTFVGTSDGFYSFTTYSGQPPVPPLLANCPLQ